MERVGERQTTRAGDRERDRLIGAPERGECGADVFEQALHGGAHIGVVAAVVGEQWLTQRVRFTEHHGFDRGRTDVEPHAQRARGVGALFWVGGRNAVRLGCCVVVRHAHGCRLNHRYLVHLRDVRWWARTVICVVARATAIIVNNPIILVPSGYVGKRRFSVWLTA